MYFSKILKRIIESQGLTLAEVAAKTGLSIGHISNLINEKRKPTPEIIKKLYKALNTAILFPAAELPFPEHVSPDEKDKALESYCVIAKEFAQKFYQKPTLLFFA